MTHYKRGQAPFTFKAKRGLAPFVFCGILFLAVSSVFGAAEIQVTGSVDKTQARIDEEISFTIRILGATGNVPAPRLPAFQGFDSFYTGRTSQFSFVNGRSSSTVEFNYVLVPKVAGRFTLNPVEVWIEGKRYATQPFQVEVEGPTPTAYASSPAPSHVPMAQAPLPAQALAPASQSPGSPPAVGSDDNVYVKAAVDKRITFPNEQILLTYTLFTRYDTRYEGFEEEPSVSGFWIEDFPLDRDLGRETVTVNGKRYVKADIRKIALFPTSAAEYTIHPGVIKVSVRRDPQNSNMFDDFFDDNFFSGASFFSRREERILKPDPLTITVRPFPETGKPKSFNGAVGQFRLTASVDKTEVKQNEPVTLQLVLEGEGNIETLAKPPVPELKAFKIYEGDSSTELLKQGTGTAIGGRKTFEIIFIPAESGEMAIPQLEFSFFDPQKQTYQTLHSQAFPLKVAPSNEPFRLPAELAQKDLFKKEVRLETKDIRYIHEELSRPWNRVISLAFQGLLLANLAGMIFTGYGLLQRRQELILSRNAALKRRKLARSQAAKRMKTLRQLARSQKPEEAEKFIGEAEKLLTEYLSNRFNLSGYQFTTRWIEEHLSEVFGEKEPLLKEQVREFYDLIGAARYGRGVLPVGERSRLVELIENVIHSMEKAR